jgi:hypothetical protein
MKFRVGMWAAAGLLVAGCWTLYALTAGPPAMTSGDPILALVQLTCPIAFFRSYPLSLYTVLLANAATYASVGFLVEILRQKQKIRQAR